MSYLQKWRQIHKDVSRLVWSSDEETYGVLESADGSDGRESLPATSESSVGQSVVSDCESFLERPPLSTSSEDSDSGSLDDENEDLNIAKPLAAWIVRHNLPREGSNELLSILRDHGHRLPSDVRTLLKTPKYCEVVEKCGGTYIYYGLETGLVKILKQNPHFFSKNDSISIEINIDGLPLFKSTRQQFWPILCAFNKFQPFVVALYYGSTKPNNVSEFMMDFLREYKELHENDLDFHGKLFRVNLKVFICDSPARSFIKCIKQHNAYNSCERCVIKGTWEGRVVFNDVQISDSRTEEGFRSHIYHDHQTGISPLIEHNIPCIESFVLDYMHLVCLGVTKRLLIFLKSGPRKCKLSSRQINEISDCLLHLTMPSDFARQPRSLNDLERWKATEFRQFLLYTGPVALRTVMKPEMYQHFLCLSVGISILLIDNDDRRNHFLAYAHQLLVYFVQHCKNYYGDTFTVYNVHNLIHITADVERFQCSANAISSFKFENYLQSIKKKVKNASNPIVQVSKRLKEYEDTNSRGHQWLRHTKICTKLKDSCFLLRDHEYAFIQEKREDNKFLCDVLIQTESFYLNPCDSKLLNIAYTSHNHLRLRRKKKLVEKKDLKTKVVCLNHSDGYVLFPMLHGVET